MYQVHVKKIGKLKLKAIRQEKNLLELSRVAIPEQYFSQSGIHRQKRLHPTKGFRDERVTA